MDHRKMNTINKNGKAFNGNRAAVFLALLLISVAIWTVIIKVMFSFFN